MSEGDLGFFVMLARQESFVDTGRELGISGSAVSRRLAKLEDRLGVRLMNRTTRRVSLTSEGEAYFRHAARILGEIETLEHNMQKAAEQPTGLLRINATLNFGREYIAPAIAGFTSRHPELEVQLVLSDAPLNLVETGIDLNIRFGVPAAGGLITRMLLRNRRFIIAAPDYLARHGAPEQLADLQRHNSIILRQEHAAYDVWRFDDLGDGSVPSAKIRGDLSTNDGEVALDWVLGGHGIMLRSEWNIARHVRAGRLRVVMPRYRQTAPVNAVYPERHNLSAKVRLFIDYLAENISSAAQDNALGLTTEELRG